MHYPLKSLAACSVLALACGDAALDAPLHESIVCAEAVVEGQLNCDVQTRRALFERWAEEAIHRPGSQFSVWVLPANGFSPLALAHATVPRRWGNGVAGAKTAWVQRAGAAIAATQVSDAAPIVVGEYPDGGSAANERVSIVDGHGRSARAELKVSAGASPVHGAIVCDRSSSTLGVSCNESALHSLYETWLAHGGTGAGSTIALWIAGRSREEAARVLEARIPDASAGERTAAALMAAWRLAHAFDGHRMLPSGSALAETMDVALDDLDEKRGEHLLMVSSDMRQATLRTWNFEREVPDSDAFIAWLRTNSLLSRLRGVQVLACGLHHQRGPAAGRFTGKLAEQVRTVWERSLTAMNARSVTLASTCDDVGAIAPPAGADIALALTR